MKDFAELGKTFRSRVLAREHLCGTHINTASLYVTENLSYAGYDYLWIDTEHAAFSYEKLLQQLNITRMAGVPAIVRTCMLDRNHTKRLLEMGPEGIIFPMINTAEEAKAAMDMCFYPPVGNRGFGPLRAVRYGDRDLEEYFRHYAQEMSHFIQIETVQAVKNLPEMVKEKRIDGFIFGPFDLSASLGMISKVFEPEMIKVMKEAIHILQAEGKSIGISSGTLCRKDIEIWTDMGINMISAGSDSAFLQTGAKQLLAEMTSVMKQGTAK